MSKPPSKFRLSLKVNIKQIIIILGTLVIIALIPIIISFLLNPEGGSITERISNAFESFELNTEDQGEKQTFTIPLLNQEIDISLLKSNPQLVIFIGIALILISIVIIMTLVKRRIRVKSKKIGSEEKK